MQLKEAIWFALNLSDRAVLSAIEEMSSAPTTFSTADGRCHQLWVLGRPTVVEGMIPEVPFGGQHPVAEWQQYSASTQSP